MSAAKIEDGFYWIKPHTGADWTVSEFHEGAFWVPGLAGAFEAAEVGPRINPPQDETWTGAFVAFADDAHPLAKAIDTWVTFSLTGEQQAVHVQPHSLKAQAQEHAAEEGRLYGQVDALGIKPLTS